MLLLHLFYLNVYLKVFFKLTLCRRGTHVYGNLLAVNLSVAVVLVPATLIVPGDSLVSSSV